VTGHCGVVSTPKRSRAAYIRSAWCAALTYTRFRPEAAASCDRHGEWNKNDPRLRRQYGQYDKETSMEGYFTIGDFVMIIPMALAGALFLGAVPCATEFRHNTLRVIGALIGVLTAVALVEALPALM
jgi:hypothetical protein